MSLPAEYSFQRYLAAKRSVEDRALNPGVWRQLLEHFASGTARKPVEVLEVGAGIGAMLERVLSAGLAKELHYVALDLDQKNLDHARTRLRSWSEARGFDFSEAGSQTCTVAHPEGRYRLEFIQAEALEFVAGPAAASRDLLIAHAFLDLVDLEQTVPALLSVLRSAGIFYFPINFDGLTILEPPIDAALDQQIVQLYHRTMDRRQVRGRPSGDSQTGRHLFGVLARAGARVLGAGSSDWVVFPIEGSYPADEAYFLHYIVHTIESALRGHPDLPPGRLGAWAEARHRQIDRAELVYIAHQLDILGQRSG